LIGDGSPHYVGRLSWRITKASRSRNQNVAVVTSTILNPYCPESP
jgi:hypothetical protein